MKETKSVIQFNENHKWCGCLGIIDEYKESSGIYLIYIDVPEQGLIYVRAKREDFDYIGETNLFIDSEREE